VGLQAPVPAAAQLAIVLDKSATYDRDAILIEDGTAQYHQRSFIPFSSIRAIAIPRETETKGRSISLSAPSSLIAEIGMVVNSFSCCFRNLSTALRRPWLARRRRRMAYRKSVFLMYSWGCVRMSTGRVDGHLPDDGTQHHGLGDRGQRGIVEIIADAEFGVDRDADFDRFSDIHAL
jgi:hypothetical protein